MNPIFILPLIYPQVIIKDSHNVILAIRISLLVEFLKTLYSTNELLPTKGSTSGQRGTYFTRYYALCADRGTSPYMSKEFKDDGLYARKCVDCNMALYKYLGLFYAILFIIFTLVYIANAYYCNKTTISSLGIECIDVPKYRSTRKRGGD